jgi:hypothetical protein
MLAHTLAGAQDIAAHAQDAITGLQAAMPKITDTSGEKFLMRVGERIYDTRADAAHAISTWANHTSDLARVHNYTTKDYGVIGQISGFDITASISSSANGLTVHVGLATTTALGTRAKPVPVPRAAFTMTRGQFLEGGVGLIQRIENRVSGIPVLLDKAHADLAAAQRDGADATARMGQPYKHALTLATAEAELVRVEQLLSTMHNESTHTTPTATPATPQTLMPTAVTDTSRDAGGTHRVADASRTEATATTPGSQVETTVQGDVPHPAPERALLTVERLRADTTPPGLRPDPDRDQPPPPFMTDERRFAPTMPALRR